MKLIYKAGNILEAYIVSGLLKSRGIEAHVAGHFLQGGVGDLATMDFANVYVAEEDSEEARVIIAEYEGIHDLTAKAVRKKNTAVNFEKNRFLLALFFVVFIFYLVAK